MSSKKSSRVVITSDYLTWLEQNEAWLVASAANIVGDIDAGCAYQNIYARALSQVARQQSRDTEVDEELVEINNYRAFATRSIRNECINIKRRQNKEVCVEEEVAESLTALTNVIDDVLLRELIDIVRACIGALSESDSRLLHLRFYEELKLEEIGTSIAESTGMAHYRIKRALEKVRNCVEPKWFSTGE